MRDKKMARIMGMALAAAVASTFAGCTALGPRPFSPEEKAWFDKATGSDLAHSSSYPAPYHEIFAPPPPYYPPPPRRGLAVPPPLAGADNYLPPGAEPVPVPPPYR